MTGGGSDGVAETRWRGYGRRTLYMNYEIIYAGRENARHGVAILFNPELAKYIETVTPISLSFTY